MNYCFCENCKMFVLPSHSFRLRSPDACGVVFVEHVDCNNKEAPPLKPTDKRALPMKKAIA